jgi:hypothetical protein
MFLKKMGCPIYKRGFFTFSLLGKVNMDFLFGNNAKVVLELVNFKKCPN